MRRMVLLLASLVTIAVVAPVARADDDGIIVKGRDPGGGYESPGPPSQGPVIGIGVKDGGHDGDGTGAGNGSGGASTCTYDGPVPDDFYGADRVPTRPKPDPKARLYVQYCDGLMAGLVWIVPNEAPPPPTPAELAEQAYRELALPVPVPRNSPDLRLPDGRQAVLVGEHTWLWVDRAAWHPASKRVQAGAVWAQVTATPVELHFDPGDGSSALSCTGPGTPYQRGRYGLHDGSPDCDFRYARSSYGRTGETVTATFSIRWRVRWIGSTGSGQAAGSLDDMLSQSTSTFVVAESQALLTSAG